MTKIRTPWFLATMIILIVTILLGCAKKVIRVPLQGTKIKDPVAWILENFSSARTLQAKASIRIDSQFQGKQANYRLSGTLFFENPDKLRVLGYHAFPLAMDLFDAFYREGEFLLLIPHEKKVFAGNLRQLDDLMERADIRITSGGNETLGVPDRIRIYLADVDTLIELILREVSLGESLPEEAFIWTVPEGTETLPLSHLIEKVESYRENRIQSR